VIDTAIGILVGLRGCSPEDAFRTRTSRAPDRIGIGSIATGLVALASGSSSPDHAEAFNAWGELIRHGRTAALAAAP